MTLSIDSVNHRENIAVNCPITKAQRSKFLGSLWDVGRNCQKVVRDILGKDTPQNFYFRAYHFDARTSDISKSTSIDFGKILNNGETIVRLLLDIELDKEVLYTDEDTYELHTFAILNPTWGTLIPKVNELIKGSNSSAFYLDSCQRANETDTLEIRVTLN